ncbi:glycosyltransferase family 2 protein [Vibrio salinus]|uniref:glycosyltransferase family 2 protein n=1 Tax=Vibrio salinus TaxID=2899784 RepID=UPI001E4E09A9|nr:glycosyltransferase [Vibrio salinus]MCE0493274.1 glycosyltransferase [Vibrio salinus]
MIDDGNVFFSVIIPTRNRPELFKAALSSVLCQQFDKLEIIVVNDGSTDAFLQGYNEIRTEFADEEKVQFYDLIHRPNGHGQSYSMNYGVSKARGKYICFLDDDDYWVDSLHLSRAFKSITEYSGNVDVYYTNQDAFYSDGTKQKNNVWIEDLKHCSTVQIKDNEGSFPVDIQFLLKSEGFAHLNCSIISKNLYNSIGGMDENIRYECDRDIYIRTIDSAKSILYNPEVISRHNIPDKKKKDNMSTLVDFTEKLIYQLRVYDKGIATSSSEALVEYCSNGKMYILKHLSEGFFKKKDIKRSLIFAKEALGIKFSFRWFAFVLYLYFSLLR